MNRIIKFSASWCKPCKDMAPQFKKFQEAHSEGLVEILDVDVDQNFELAAEYGVKGVPHTVFIKDGSVADRISGVADYNKLNEKYLQTYSSSATA